MQYKSIEEVLNIANTASGHQFKQYDKHNRLASRGNKGGLGQIIEEGLFGYEINSNPEADFKELGLELKVTPIKENKNGTYSAKERLVLNIIDFMSEYKYVFEDSAFWRKNERLLLMFYLWEKEKSRDEYHILKSIVHEFSDKDFEIIRQDWEYIVERILKGEAHELSEGDTMYLGACTKGANRKSLRQQPFSDIPAMQRAFSLKQSYMTAIVRREFNQEEVQRLTTSQELQEKTIEEILQERFAPYIGKTLTELSEQFSLPLNKKNKARIIPIVSRILGIKGTKLEAIEEFSKANIEFKTIRLEPNGLPKEHMSFEQVDFQRWLTEDFEDSQFYEKFEATKFLFTVFEYRETARENPNRELYLKKIVLWNMPERTIQNELRNMWQAGRAVLREGVKFTPTSRGVSNNLPGAKFNGVCHIRPKAQKASDKVQLPDGQMVTKQAYWLNNGYIADIVKD